MTSATATPSTKISATVFAAVLGKSLQATFFAWRKFHDAPVSSHLPPKVLNDIGVHLSSRMTLQFA